MMQALGWAMNRGPLVRPLNLVQFLFVYSCPITPREGESPQPAWAVLHLAVLPQQCSVVRVKYIAPIWAMQSWVLSAVSVRLPPTAVRKMMTHGTPPQQQQEQQGALAMGAAFGRRA